jgi:hypothetical protein
MVHSETDNFGAARLTLAKIRAMIEADCGADCWIGIPCRDIAYFWSRSQSDARREQNEQEVRSVWEQDDYNLSPTPISFRKFSSVLKDLSV